MENGSDIENASGEAELELVRAKSEMKHKGVSDLGIVTAKGTGNGLILKIDPDTEWDLVHAALLEYVSKRKAFLVGQSVVLDWQGGDRPTVMVQQLITELRDRFQLSVRSGLERVLKTVSIPSADDSRMSKDRGQGLSIFDGMNNYSDESPDASVPARNADFEVNFKSSTPNVSDKKAGDWDTPDCRIFYKTLRSGQRIETENSVVLVGDVNSGAEIVAGGDVVVLGTVRGVVHAGAFDETGGGRFIFAMDLNPTQLRIGSVISRGSSVASKQPEMARVDGNNIIVEPYSVKAVHARMNGI